jgi:circadian clock protein KaiB
MGDHGEEDLTRVFEGLLIEPRGERYELVLFVTGMSRQSLLAVTTVKAVCEEHLAGRYRLEVVDVYLAPERVRELQVIAAPTLVRTQPPPLRRLIGGLSCGVRVARGLELIAGGVE